MSGRAVWGLGAAAVSGLLVLGYCIYFDHQRRSDPNFKKNLREKRKQRRLAKSSTGSSMPDLRDQEAVQKYFLSEVQLGEELLSQGDVDNAVEHLGSAIAVCGHPQQLLHILQQTLPPQVFHLLLQRLPMIGQAVHAKQLAAYGAPVGQSSASSVLGMSLSSSSEGATVEEIPSTLKLDDELE